MYMPTYCYGNGCYPSTDNYTDFFSPIQKKTICKNEIRSLRDRTDFSQQLCYKNYDGDDKY